MVVVRDGPSVEEVVVRGGPSVEVVVLRGSPSVEEVVGRWWSLSRVRSLLEVVPQ